MRHPRHGGRVLLEREHAGGDGARYRVTLYSPERRWRATATLAAAGQEPEVGAWDGEGAPPDWLEKAALAHLRTLGKRSREEGWPRRVLRWRRER